MAIMTAINASEEAYKRILKQKREMEETLAMIVPMSDALDVLLGVVGDV